MSLRLCLLLTLLFGVHPVQADPQEKTFYEHVEWAKRAPSEAYSDPNMTLTLSEFCNTPGCEQRIERPDEAGMSDAAITDKATTEYYQNEQAKAIQDNFDNNDAAFNPDDPSYRFAGIAIDNAYDIAHGRSNPFVDCDSGEQCFADYHAKTCSESTLNSVPCERAPVLTPVLGTTRYRCDSGWTLQGNTCYQDVTECRYNSHSYAFDNITGRCSGKNPSTSRSQGAKWDGEVLSNGYWRGAIKYSKSGHSYCGSEGGSYTWSTKNYEVCRHLTLTEPATLYCDSGYALSGTQCVKNTITWKTQCTLLNECTVTNQVCIEGAGTRTINGVPTYLDCWKYQVNHQCDLGSHCSPLSECTETERTCSLKLNGVCVKEEVSKTCEEKQCKRNLVCGETSFCLDGDCFEAMPTTDGSFHESAAALAALAEAATGLGDPPMIFSGQGMQCTDKAFGFADCCKDGGWGTGVGLDECNAEEKALGQAKEQGVTIALGSYCASSVLGVCTRKKRGYCVFDSKLARIIQAQGAHQQLGIEFGSAKSPQCDAITPEQLQEIDFELIDFSDFYGDMSSNTNLPSEDEIKERIQSAYAQ